MKGNFSVCVPARGIALVVVGCWSHSAAAQDCDALRPSHPDSPFNVGQSVTSRISNSGHFRVWYSLDGEHAPPDAALAESPYVGEALSIAEGAYAHYAALGYAPVVSDQVVPCAAHDDAIDIYLMNFGGSADGTKVDEVCGAVSAESCSGFLIVENDFAGYAYADQTTALRTVVPHEYFHLIQARYDARIEPWFAEAGAQWATDTLYPGLGDMERFFPVYFKQPERSLDSASGGAAASFSYATALFALFLEEAYSADVMRGALEQLAFTGPPSTLAIDVALNEAHGSSIAAAFQRFALWNSATGRRAGSEGYIEAASYPEVALSEVAEPMSVKGATISLSSRYYEVTLERFSVEIETDSDRNRVWYVPLVQGEADVAAARVLEEPEPLGPGLVIVVGVTTLRSDAPFELVFSDPSEPPGDAGSLPEAGLDAGPTVDAADTDGAAHPQPSGDGCRMRPGRTRNHSWLALVALLGPWLLAKIRREN
ncbi:MAG: hypothetical protein KC766_04975 [Myxococcales bacterium]|nr:hypothetical protein [Myxococcales bacterium]